MKIDIRQHDLATLIEAVVMLRDVAQMRVEDAESGIIQEADVSSAQEYLNSLDDLLNILEDQQNA